MRLTTILIPGVLLAGCAAQGEFINVGERSARVEVPPTAAIKLSIPVGEVVVRGDDGTEDVVARVDISCRANDKGCLRRVEKTQFVTGADTTAIVMSLEPGGMLAWRDVQARVEVVVPRDHALFVDMGAGELEITDMHNCASLDMYAGDASMRFDKSVVGSVTLDVGTGDTSLQVDGRWLEGKRVLLVGAELEWNEGDGWCEVFGDLQFGDLTVYLEEG